MSNYKVLREIGIKLRETLWQAFSEDPEIAELVKGEMNIVFTNPTETVKNASHRLSLWLYHVSENDYLKNKPMLRGQGNAHDRSQFPPLALNLFYLVTPFAPLDNPEANLTLLGKTMEVLYDHSSILLQNEDEELAQDVRILMSAVTLEELTRIWDSLKEPYRLSVCYEARVIQIASARKPVQERVTDRDVGFAAEE